MSVRISLFRWTAATLLALVASVAHAHVPIATHPGEEESFATLPTPLSGMRRSGSDVTVAASSGGVYAADLPPGRYGTVRLDPGAEIVLSSGDYEIKALFLGEGATVWLDPFDATGDDRIDPIALWIGHRLDVGPGAEFALLDPEHGSPRDVEITVLQRTRLTIPPDAVVRGTLIAPLARVTFREGSRLEGAVFAERLRFDPGAEIVYHANPAE